VEARLMRSVIFSLLLVSSLFAQQAKPTKEAELKKAAAAGLAELAGWCQSKKLLEEGKRHNDEALGLDPDNAKAKALKEKLTGASEAGESDVKEYGKKLETYGKKIAGFYLQLFREKHQPPEQARFDGYLLKALDWDAKAATPAVDAEARDAVSKKDWNRAAAMLKALEKEKSDPARAKLLRDVELKGAETSAILKKASTHEMQYYLALPKGWNTGRKWPIVVGIDGAGCNWMGMMNSLLGNRGDRPFIIVSLITFSNTNGLKEQRAKYPYSDEVIEAADRNGRMKFDEPGLLAVLEDVRKEFNGEDKFCITGFSGGGNLTWRMTFGHPEKLMGSAPASANFYNAGEISSDPARETVPIKVFQGAKDEYLNKPPNLAAQWEMAKKLLDDNGFKNYSYVLVPEAGHSGCGKEVMEFFASLLPGANTTPKK
jgi:predicted esterase